MKIKINKIYFGEKCTQPVLISDDDHGVLGELM